MIYTRNMGLAVRSIKPPYPKIKMHIVDCGTYLGVRIYEKNINKFSELQKISVMEYCYQVRDILSSFPNIVAHLEGVPAE